MIETLYADYKELSEQQTKKLHDDMRKIDAPGNPLKRSQARQASRVL
jgi:hypothetical protein